MDILYMFTVSSMDILEISDAVSAIIAVTYVTFVVFSLTLKQDEWKAIFRELLDFGTSDHIGAYDQLKEDCKFVRKLTLLLMVIDLTAIAGYLSMPFVQYYVMHRGPNDTTPYPIIFHSWYPFDRYQSPYFEITAGIENVRLFYCSLAMGMDCLFNGVLVLVIGQFCLLQRNFINIRQNAMNNLQYPLIERREEVDTHIQQEIKKLLNANVKKHQKLLR